MKGLTSRCSKVQMGYCIQVLAPLLVQVLHKGAALTINILLALSKTGL